jgi:hypothetical protein
MVALLDVTVLQGELRTLGVRLPTGYELTGVSGSSLENSEPTDEGLTLTIANPAARSHQFLISLERPHDGGSFSLNTGFVAVRDVQRERGEVAIEGVGTLELDAPEREPLHRIDVRELNRAVQSLARLPLLSAFRYQRAAGASPTLAFDVKRFADAGVLAAVADRAVATTLVTGEGRALTEVILTVQNRAQPFLKVSLPQGARWYRWMWLDSPRSRCSAPTAHECRCCAQASVRAVRTRCRSSISMPDSHSTRKAISK